VALLEHGMTSTDCLTQYCFFWCTTVTLGKENDGPLFGISSYMALKLRS
jgi:hypothetical protein